MIKPCDAAPSVTQTTAGIVERSPDIPSGDAWWTATRTTTSGCRGSVAAATRWRFHAEAVLLSDRVGVMTAGPNATIREIVEIHLPRPRMRSNVDFGRLYERINQLIVDEVRKSRAQRHDEP